MLYLSAVTLSAEPDYQGQGFSGFQMAAFRESCPQEIVGTFDGPLPDKAKAFSCVGGVKVRSFTSPSLKFGKTYDTART